MFKKFTYAVTISALSVVALASVASASGPYADFTIANGDPNEEMSRGFETKVQPAITVEQPEMLNIRGGDDSDFAITVEQHAKLNIQGGDDSDKPSINVGSNPVKPNIQGGDDSDKPTVSTVKLNIGASDPAEQD